VAAGEREEGEEGRRVTAANRGAAARSGARGAVARLLGLTGRFGR
jgi:hypothetical protein